jgi:uroporphyrinogen decarboxylase
MTELTSRERVTMALNHEEPDRVPLDLGGCMCSSLMVEAYEKLKTELSISAPTGFLNSTFRVAALAEEALVRLGSDFRPLLPQGGVQPLVGTAQSAEADLIFDELGAGYRPITYQGGFYNEQATFPLREATIDDLASYPWPDPNDPARYEGLEEATQRLYETPYALMGDCGYPGLWEPVWSLLGYERALVDLVGDEEFIVAVLERLYGIASIVMQRFLEITGRYLSVIRIADDLATQASLQMSPETYRKVIKPFHKRYFSLIKKYTDAKIFYHSDGNVTGLIDDLIDAGIDILNPIQVSALPDPASLKMKYGDRLSFWGAIDTHRVLPFGTPEDVYDEVRLRIKQLGRGGGYVVGAVHNVQADVPVRNILAIGDAVRKYGAYPVS